MIDIHCHIIPWIDDGAYDARTACHMAEHAYESGVEAIVVTPHSALDGIPTNLRGRLHEIRVGMFRELLQRRGIPLAVLSGSELYASSRLLPELLEQRRVITLNHSRYLLTEFRFDASAVEIERALRLITSYGYIPVIAHPERYSAVQNSFELAAAWFSRGYILQVNKGSLLGRLGYGAAETAMHLLQAGLIHVIASDAHDTRHRPTGFQSLIPLLKKHCPPEYIEVMLEINPLRIVTDQDILLEKIDDPDLQGETL